MVAWNPIIVTTINGNKKNCSKRFKLNLCNVMLSADRESFRKEQTHHQECCQNLSPSHPGTRPSLRGWDFLWKETLVKAMVTLEWNM